MANLSNFTPPSHPEGITLEGQLVRLEPLDSKKHAQQLFESNSEEGGEGNWTYLPYGPFNAVSDYSDWLRICCLDRLLVSVAKFASITRPTDCSVNMAPFERLSMLC